MTPNKQHNALIVFCKRPLPGQVKTRLAKDIGDEAAAKVYITLLEQCASACAALPCDVFVFSNDFPVANPFKSKRYHHRIQHGENLGEKMSHAVSDVFKSGYSRVVIIGSDCPGISTQLLNQAFEQIHSTDVVIGPSNDGGYYLLGMNSNYTALFHLASWSHDKVYDDTIKIIEQKNLTYHSLKTLIDIDTFDDLISVLHAEDIEPSSMLKTAIEDLTLNKFKNGIR